MNHPTPYSATSPVSLGGGSLHSLSELLIDDDEPSRVDIFVEPFHDKQSDDFVKTKPKCNSMNCPKARNLLSGENDTLQNGGLLFDDSVTELFKKPVLSSRDKLLSHHFFEKVTAKSHPKGALDIVQASSQSNQCSEIKETAKDEKEIDELGNLLSKTLDGAMQIIQSTSNTSNHTKRRSKLRMTRSFEHSANGQRRAGRRHRSSNGARMMQYPSVYWPKSFSKEDINSFHQAEGCKHERVLSIGTASSQESTISSLGQESLSDIMSEVVRRKSLPAIDSALRKDETMHDSAPKRPSRCHSPCPSSS